MKLGNSLFSGRSLLTLVWAVIFAALSLTARADRWATLAGLGDRLEVAAGEIVLVVHVPGSQVKLTYQKTGGPEVSLDLDGTNRGSINGNRGQVTVSSPLPLAGPATVVLRNSTVVGLKVVSTETKLDSAKAAQGALVSGGVPSTAVVIPAESTGPVDVVLESSVDLITWNRAEPGTYGAASSNRFFRVRALAQ